MPDHHKSLEDMTEPELRAQMQSLCLAIQATLPEGTGFIVLAASWDGRIAQYASNTERESAEEWMLETLLRWKRNDHTPR